MLADTRKYPTITTAFSLADDQLSQASTSSNSTASSVAIERLTASKSFEGQILPERNYGTTNPCFEDQEEDDISSMGFRNFPRRQLSLSSANRKRLQPERRLKSVDNRPAEILAECSTEARKSLDNLGIPDVKIEYLMSDQLTSKIHTALVIEEDELAAESTNSCACSDDGFESSCHENDSSVAKERKVPKASSQTTESDFMSDDSANESDRQSLTKTEGVVGPEAVEIQHLLMANQQVTAL